MRDFGSHVTIKRLIPEATSTSSPAAVVIDRGTVNNNLYEGITFAMFVGAGGITFTPTNYLALKLEDSDDGITFANVVSGETLLGPNAGAPGGQPPDANGFVRLLTGAKGAADTDPFKVSYVGSRRYVRATIVYGGTHSAGTLAGLWAALGFPGSMPAA
jgi:hypothetical protein